ncbi:MAG: GTP 3',8-cyclase MoaA [Deltaproteobacteria bacterium]|jgi:cyclic pyranopterin phosphate synthase|nr:GTP 3',8-cyclase MoaA [Deltaproteobacteria bacterium]
MELIDGCGRKIDYLRISITDQCNLRCGYCMPMRSRRHHVNKADILTFEELVRLGSAAVTAGIKKIRITGGEPLVRNSIVQLCRMLAKIDGLEELTLTTNGVRLKQLAQPLKDAGVQRVNISLDTLIREKFKKITGKDRLLQVLTGIREAEKIGLAPIKINTVVMRGINDDEVPDLAGLSVKNPYQVRFIEMMPIDKNSRFIFKQMYISTQDIIKKIPDINQAHIVFPQKRSGPAKLFALPGAKGCIGFISAVSQHFCRNCNRLRLTANGKLRTCLFAKDETDFKSALQKGAGKVDLIELFRKSILNKPQQHEESASDLLEHLSMYAIGG